MFFGFIAVFVSVLFLLMSVAFITLLERLILALSQLRKGPNKTGGGGLIQPLVDGVKLLLKSFIVPFQAFSFLFVVGAAWILMVMILVWTSFKSFPLESGVMLSSWFLVLVLGFGVYGTFLGGLSGVSKYGFLGSVRGCVQSVSYEVSFALVVFSLVVLGQHADLVFWSSSVLWGVLPLWLVSCVAETNRPPVDFAEGESELISGFNIELGSFPLAFIFVGEYGMVLCFSWFTSVMFFGGGLWAAAFWVYVSLVLRSTFPRFRYDKLLAFCWTRVLPLAAAWVLLALTLHSS